MVAVSGILLESNQRQPDYKSGALPTGRSKTRLRLGTGQYVIAGGGEAMVGVSEKALYPLSYKATVGFDRIRTYDLSLPKAK